MKLDDFIEQSLVAISKGVKSAQRKAHVTIAPGFIEGEAKLEPQMVHFEIEVTTSAEGGGGIDVLSLGELRAGGSKQNSHKIVFEVPVHFNSDNVLADGWGEERQKG